MSTKKDKPIADGVEEFECEDFISPDCLGGDCESCWGCGCDCHDEEDEEEDA